MSQTRASGLSSALADIAQTGPRGAALVKWPPRSKRGRRLSGVVGSGRRTMVGQQRSWSTRSSQHPDREMRSWPVEVEVPEPSVSSASQKELEVPVLGWQKRSKPCTWTGVLAWAGRRLPPVRRTLALVCTPPSPIDTDPVDRGHKP